MVSLWHGWNIIFASVFYCYYSVYLFSLLLQYYSTSTFSFVCIAEFREIHHLVDNICTVAGLLPGKTYAFRVKARNEVGVRTANPAKDEKALVMHG